MQEPTNPFTFMLETDVNNNSIDKTIRINAINIPISNFFIIVFFLITLQYSKNFLDKSKKK